MLYTENLQTAKSFDHGQPVQIAQADEGQYFLQFP